MANGYNPYGIATTQQGLLENLMASQQSQKLGAIATGEQKGKMTEEFDKELIAKQKEQQELLKKKRKKSPLEKLMPLIALTTGAFGLSPLIGGVLSGVSGMAGLGKDKKHELSKASKIENTLLDKSYGNTFLGSGARKFGAATDSLAADIREQADFDDFDFLKKGLIEGIQGYTTGQLGTGIGESLGTAKLSKGLSDEAATALTGAADTTAATALAGTKGFENLSADQLTKLFESGLVGAHTPMIKALFQGLTKDPSTLLSDKDGGKNAIKNILNLLIQSQGDE